MMSATIPPIIPHSMVHSHMTAPLLNAYPHDTMLLHSGFDVLWSRFISFRGRTNLACAPYVNLRQSVLVNSWRIVLYKRCLRESVRVEAFLRFKVKNELKKADYGRLVEFLAGNPRMSIEVLSGADLEFVSVGPVMVAVEGCGYGISVEVLLKQPIGFEIYDGLKPNDEMRSCLEVNRRSFRLSKVVTELADLEKDLDLVLRTMERIVNHVFIRFGQVVERTFRMTSELVDRQLDMALRREELAKRDEKPLAFSMIHAGDARDAKERASDLVPVYWERDKAYLYEDKKVFILLPRNFVMKLLKLEGTVMMPIDQFTDLEKEVLKQFTLRHYIRTRKIQDKIYYFDLDATTRKLLVKGLMKH
jgi:hypothetical protein